MFCRACSAARQYFCPRVGKNKARPKDRCIFETSINYPRYHSNCRISATFRLQQVLSFNAGIREALTIRYTIVQRSGSEGISLWREEYRFTATIGSLKFSTPTVFVKAIDICRKYSMSPRKSQLIFRKKFKNFFR